MLNYRKLNEELLQIMETHHVPGLAVAIVERREVVYAQGLGVTATEDGGLPVTPQTLFRIGSMTKPLTGTMLMRLVEAGKLDLDRPVTAYLPWLNFSEPRVVEQVTLRRLLSHTSGLPTDAEHFGRREAAGLAEGIRQDIPAFALVAPPGKVFSYSNPGINLAGHLGEVAAEKPYAQLMQEMVFDPLQMARTTFDPTVAMTYPVAQSHDLADDGKLHVQHRFADNVAHYPSGFALSTVLDLANFALLHLSQGAFAGQRLLTPGSVAEMHRAQADLYSLTGAGYGLTFFVGSHSGQWRVGHSGAISTFGSRLDMAPETGAAIIVLFNRLTPPAGMAINALAERALDELQGLPGGSPKPEPVAADRTSWPGYEGSYLSDMRGLATVQATGEGLTLDFNGTLVPLSACRRDLYFGQRPDREAPTAVGFVGEDAGPAQYIVVDGQPFRRFAPVAAPADPVAWAAYPGVYDSPLVQMTITLQGDRLFIQPKGAPGPMPCIPLGGRRFASDAGLVEFQPAEGGPTPALLLAGRFTLVRV